MIGRERRSTVRVGHMLCNLCGLGKYGIISGRISERETKDVKIAKLLAKF